MIERVAISQPQGKPNIDRIAKEGMIFTDYSAEQSCTAGRSSFIIGQATFRTGLSKVGVPGSRVGLQKEDPAIAELLKNRGYATGQFGRGAGAADLSGGCVPPEVRSTRRDPVQRNGQGRMR
jgi:arylsulfatase A-like enzyme